MPPWLLRRKRVGIGGTRWRHRLPVSLTQVSIVATPRTPKSPQVQCGLPRHASLQMGPQRNVRARRCAMGCDAALPSGDAVSGLRREGRGALTVDRAQRPLPGSHIAGFPCRGLAQSGRQSWSGTFFSPLRRRLLATPWDRAKVRACSRIRPVHPCSTDLSTPAAQNRHAPAIDSGGLPAALL
jgi:hypothetical protein